uniref:Uncharacterized protein n=1 Tax=Oryza rufipogon TaxID=4529 RepID=A0A0E0RFI4_ORYRU
MAAGSRASRQTACARWQARDGGRMWKVMVTGPNLDPVETEAPARIWRRGPSSARISVDPAAGTAGAAVAADGQARARAGAVAGVLWGGVAVPANPATATTRASVSASKGAPPARQNSDFR